MKTSIRTRVLRLLLPFVAAILLVLGAAALYSMDWGKKFASHYATEISNRAIDNSSDNIVAMRQDELLFTVEKAADDEIRFSHEGRYRCVAHYRGIQGQRLVSHRYGKRGAVLHSRLSMWVMRSSRMISPCWAWDFWG